LRLPWNQRQDILRPLYVGIVAGYIPNDDAFGDGHCDGHGNIPRANRDSDRDIGCEP